MEFSLVVLVFLFLVVMIIEVARIMQAYVTIHHAAREAARYAVTGQWDAKYKTDPDAGWTPDSLEPLQQIPPCWPRFDDDPYGGARPPSAFAFYEPYRDARTCTIEETAIRSMAGLVMNPLATSEEPDFYEIAVKGSMDNIYPTSGPFSRDDDLDGDLDVNYTSGPLTGSPHDYGFYFPAVVFTTPSSGLSRGAGGLPNRPVVVQIRYRQRLITPLLSNIVPSLELKATAIMVNESFGSSGLQRKSVPPPDDVDPGDLADVVPPDLVVTSITPPTGSITAGSSVAFSAKVKNDGQENIPLVTVYNVSLYAYPSATPLSADPKPADIIGCGTCVLMQSVAGGAYYSTHEADHAFNNVTFPAGGTYYVYVWADSGASSAPNSVDEDGPTGALPEHETNNVRELGPISVNGQIDLEVVKATTNGTNFRIGEVVNYSISVHNYGPDDATGSIFVQDTLPPELEYVAGSATGPGVWFDGPDTINWDIPALANGATETLTFQARVISGTAGATITNTAGADSQNLILSEPIPDPHNNLGSVSITVVGFDLAVDKTGPSGADEGDTILYTVTVNNVSNDGTTATGVTITDTWPGDRLDYVSSSVPCTTSGGPVTTVTCNLTADIPQGGSTSVTFTGTVRAGTAGQVIHNTALVSSTTPLTETSTTNNTDYTDLTVKSIDLSLTKTASVTSVLELMEFTYTITVRNSSPTDDAGSVVVEDVLNAGLVLVTATPSRGTYDAGTGIWSVGDLVHGAEAILTLRVYASGGTGNTTIPNLAEITSFEGGDPDLSDNSDSVSVDIVPLLSDLQVEKTSITSMVAVGLDFDYIVTVTNAGPSSAADLIVRDLVDSNLEFQSATPNQGTYNSTSGQWDIGDLANGAVASLTLTVRVRSGVAPDTIIPNTASILSFNGTDPVTSNNQATFNVTVGSTADLELSKSVGPSVVANPGDIVTYTLEVFNNGPAPVVNRSVQDADLPDLFLDGTFSFVSASATMGTVNSSGQWTGITLNAGESAMATILVRVIGSGIAENVTNTASIIPDGTDPNTGNDSDSATLTINVFEPIFVNVGDRFSCPQVTWGSQSSLGVDHTWQQNQTYSAGSWGLINNDATWWDPWYHLNQYGPPDSNRRFVQQDHTELTPQGDARNLLGCRIQGTDFSYRFDNLLPGTYNLVLVFSEWIADSRSDRYMDISANGVMLLNDFRVVAEIANANGHPTSLPYHGWDPRYVHYLVREIEVTVSGTGVLNVKFDDVGGDEWGLLNGIGIEYLHP